MIRRIHLLLFCYYYLALLFPRRRNFLSINDFKREFKLHKWQNLLFNLIKTWIISVLLYHEIIPMHWFCLMFCFLDYNQTFIFHEFCKILLLRKIWYKLGSPKDKLKLTMKRVGINTWAVWYRSRHRRCS